MYRAHDDAADKNPQQCRHPAPYNGDGRTDDGACAGDGCKMMPENHLFFGRHIINAVFKFHGRGRGTIRQFENFVTDKPAIPPVHENVACKGKNHNQ